MASPDELAGTIRFALSELSARNGHHEFEELTRHLARARIVSNVVPATGPVGAGGDQGRDLETFRTYLAQELGPHGGFLALASDETVAFACTLQADGLTTKIKGDVDKIMGGGSRVDHVVAFVVGTVPVGQRHTLQDDIRAAHEVELDVWDSLAISQELSADDTFWIAARYLTLPAELAPSPSVDDSPEWYAELRDEWRGREPVCSLADLLAIKEGLRRSTFHQSERPDLPFWLDLMRYFLRESCASELQHRAMYEVSVATLRGAGDLTPSDELAAAFIEGTCEADSPFELEDGSVLLLYCIGALARRKTKLAPEALSSWNQRLRGRVESLLAVDDLGPNRPAVLLQVLGHLRVHPDPLRVETKDEPIPDVAEMIDENADLDFSPEHSPDSAENVMVDLDGAMAAWAELAAILPDASLFPIERFAEQFGILAALIVDHPLFRDIADAVDDQVTATSGRSAAAAHCRDRAIALRKAEKYVASLRELHQAKAGWWSGDALRGSLLTLFLIADCYEQLGFLHAAKQSVLLAARIAADSDDDDLQDLFAGGVRIAAHMDYGLGNWLSSAATAEAGLLLHSNLVAAIDLDDQRVERTMFELMWVYLAGRDLFPPMGAKTKALLEAAGMWETIEEATREAAPKTPSDWLDTAGEQLRGEWMGDLRATLRIAFSGLGTTWTLRGENRPEVARALERFAAAAEVLLAELASDDLALMRTAIEVQVDVGITDGERVVPLPSNEGRRWQVLLSPWNDTGAEEAEAVHTELLAVLTSILGEASLLPFDEFMERMNEAFRRGLSHKVSLGPPLDALLQWVAHEDYESLRTELSLPPELESDNYVPLAAPEVVWQEGPGPTYDPDAARAAIEKRYEAIDELFTFTLLNLRKSSEFAGTVEELRGRGWLDWHILNCVASAATNHRMQSLGLDQYLADPGAKGEEARTAYRMLAFEPETAELDPVPLAVFSAENLEFNRVVGLAVFVQGVGLELHQETPDIPAVEGFLEKRYRYWLDDIPHDDPFA